MSIFKRISTSVRKFTAKAMNAIRPVSYGFIRFAVADANHKYYAAAQTASSRVKTIGYEKALREAVTNLAEQGVAAYTTKSGARVPVDVGIRQAMNDGIHKFQLQQTLDIATEAGAGLVEVNSTANARPSHANWQGKIYQLQGQGKYPNFYTECRYGDPVHGIGGYNCGHQASIYHEGYKRVYQDPLEGTGYTTEEARKLVSTQRRYENDIRKQKRVIHALERAGLDTKKERFQLKGKQAKLQKLVDDNPALLTRQKSYRERVKANVSRLKSEE